MSKKFLYLGMEAKDLRIGNYVSSDNSNTCIVNGFSPFGHSVRCDESEGCNIHFDIIGHDGTFNKGWETDSADIAFIPLTEEWLIKFGFIKNEISKSIYDIPPLGHYFILCKSEYYEFCVDLEGGFCLTKIQYLHQLQNLYFALTGGELTFKD